MYACKSLQFCSVLPWSLSLVRMMLVALVVVCPLGGPVFAQDATQAASPPGAAVVEGQAPPRAIEHNGKQAYNGPIDVVELPPAPMLDEEGKQRLDPDGKPMFNPPVKQLRDKKGHPVFDPDGKPVFQTAGNLGYDEHGKKIKVKKEKPPKATPVSIVSGILTVDGWTGKARLNYDITDLKFMYIYAPAIGTTVISLRSFPGATEQRNAIADKTLRVTVEGHVIELSSDKRLMGKKSASAWVVVDRGFLLPAKFPVFGHGTTSRAPYAWPGSKVAVDEAAAQPPPLPVDVQPALALAPCPTGMMRPASPPVLPGQTASEQPCVPIKAGEGLTK